MSIHLRFLFGLLLIMPILSFGQFTDDFSDGDFTSNPVWSGDVSLFTIANDQLRSNSPGAAEYYLSTPSTSAINVQWEFFINLKFGTSGANYVDIYLTSDSADLTNTTNGYFVRIGGTPDEISLYKNVNGSESILIDGPDGIVNSSSDNPFKIKVIFDAFNNWTLEYDDGATGIFTNAGSVNDASITTSNFFGILITQSSASSPINNHFFDDFYVGPVVGDTTPPVLTSLTVISSNELDVQFSEPVESASAENPSNYSVNNSIGNPASAISDSADSSIVHLTFGTPFQNGTRNELTVKNIEDLNGNKIVSASEEFIYFIPDTAAAGDVIINEIFADPTPSVGLPEFEYLELYNRSNKAFDLSGWQLSGDNISSAILLPDEYLILCPSSAVDSFSRYGNVAVVSSFSLTNSGEELLLTNNSNTLIDAVTYTIDWFNNDNKDDGGWSLERIDPDFTCPSDENWTASNNQAGGTPGNQNSVYGTFTDSIAPNILSIKVLAKDSLLLTFSEQVDSASLITLTNYFVDNGIGNPSAAISPTPGLTEVALTFSSSFDSSTVYNLDVSGLRDCIGNMLMATATFALPEQPERHDILITEILADPEPIVGLPKHEFVELFNASNKTITLGSLIFSDGSGSTQLSDKLILPGEYVILTSENAEDEYQTFGEVLGINFPSLTNSGEELTLRDNTGEVIHYVEYSDSWYRSSLKKDGGFSLEMIDTGNPCSGRSNWRDSNSPTGGTPGETNSVAANNSDSTAPALLRALVLNDMSVKLFFDESLNPAEITTANYMIDPPSTAVSNIFAEEPAFKEIILILSSPLQTGTIYSIEINDLSDCSGNLIGIENTARFGVPEPIDTGDLLINEILFNPASGGADFVELYNISDKVIDLKEVVIAEADPFLEDSVIDFARATLTGFQVLPAEYVVLSSDPDVIKNQYYTSNPKGFLKVSGMPNYPDDEGVVLLLDTSGLYPQVSALDKLHYYDDWHFGLLDDEDGVSLERISFDLPTQDENNWHSAASTVNYATPGYRNSQFGQVLAASGTISIDPEVFSPNNDGFEDQLNIRYEFEQPGNVANITVYDDDGRKIRDLVRNELLDTSGSLRWDGLDDSGAKARIGIYVLITEIFDLKGNTSKYKHTCVVASKL